MTVYNVVPKRGNRKGWKVEADGRVTSRHNTKANALSAARDRASSGDQIIIHRSNGRIQKRRRVR